MEVSREQNEWMEVIKEKQKGGKKRGKKGGKEERMSIHQWPGLYLTLFAT